MALRTSAATDPESPPLNTETRVPAQRPPSTSCAAVLDPDDTQRCNKSARPHPRKPLNHQRPNVRTLRITLCSTLIGLYTGIVIASRRIDDIREALGLQ